MGLENPPSTFPKSPAQPAQKERTPEEVERLREKLHLVTKVISRGLGVKIIPGEEWAAGLSPAFEEERLRYPDKSLDEFDEALLKPEIITYDENDLLDRSEDFIFGVLRHEIGHIKNSDYRSLIEAQDMIKAEGYKPLDAHFIWNAWEDGRSNNIEASTSKRARSRLGAYLKEHVDKALPENFSEKPLPIQYGMLCWARGAELILGGSNFEEIKDRIKDKRITEVFDQTAEALGDYLEETSGKKAFEEILWEKGWPVFKSLVENYLEEEAKKQYEEEKKKEQPQEKEEKSEEEDGATTTVPPPEVPVMAGENEAPWEELPHGEKNKYKQKAREKLDQEEREALKFLLPKSLRFVESENGDVQIELPFIPPETIERFIAAEDDQTREEEERSKRIEASVDKKTKDALETIEGLKERESGLNKSEREKYEKYYAPVKKYVDHLVERLDEIFPPAKEGEWQTGYQRGKRIDVRRLASQIPTEQGKFFKRQETAEISELAFSLLIDISGSMAEHGKIENALSAAILMAEAFSKKVVPFEVLAFHTRLLELKRFNEEYSGNKKAELITILDEVGTYDAQYNNDGFAVDSAARRLQTKLVENEANGALIVFSDGQPAPSPTFHSPEWELNKIVREWSKKLPLMGIGIGPGMEGTIHRYYGRNGIPVRDVHQLPRALLRVLESQIGRFKK